MAYLVEEVSQKLYYDVYKLALEYNPVIFRIELFYGGEQYWKNHPYRWGIQKLFVARMILTLGVKMPS